MLNIAKPTQNDKSAILIGLSNHSIEMNSRMENVASYINESQENGTFLKFPFWQPTLAVWAITILLVNPTIVAIDLTLLVTMLKTKNLRRNPLNFIHISILVSQIASRLTFLIGYATYMLPAWRDCSCSIFLNSFVLSLYIFLSAYDPIAFAFLSCLQLLQVKGKKRLRKSVIISICFSIACSMIFGIEFIAFQAKYDFRDLLVCSQVCASDQQMRTFSVALVSATIPVFLTLLPLVLIPSLITVIITATWSCIIFKNSYTGGNDQLNKKDIVYYYHCNQWNISAISILATDSHRLLKLFNVYNILLQSMSL